MASDRSLAITVHVALLACALSIGSGCSLAITGPDPQRPRQEVPRCDTGKGAVGMDALMTTLLGVASLAAFASDESGAGLALGASSGLFLASGLRGNNAANDCRAAFVDYNLAYAQQQQDPPLQDTRLRSRLPKRPAQQPVAVQPPPPQPALDPQQPLEPAQPEPQDVAPTYATPRPPPVAKQPTKPPAKQPDPPKKPVKPSEPVDDEDWDAFWKESP